MTSEYGIPALKGSAATNFPFFQTQLQRHLEGVGESRLIDPTYRLPQKTVVTQLLNPFWVDPDVVQAQGSSSTTIEPTPDHQQDKWITSTTTVQDDIVTSYSPGLKEAGGIKEIPYKILNAQMIGMFSRLLDTSLHHLLVYNRNINTTYSAAAVYHAIKAHFSCSVWMTKDDLVRRWEDIRVCTDPEFTYNQILALNQECIQAGQGYSDFQAASKFVHLLQTADKRAYIHLLTELARVGEQAHISQMWFVAQVTWKQIKAEQATPAPSQHLGMAAQGPPSRTCIWCTAPGHIAERCFAKDPDNMTKYPQQRWNNNGPSESMKRRYNRKMTQKEATDLYKGSGTSTPYASHQVALAWTPPPIYTAVPVSTLQSLDQLQGRVPTTITDPEPVTDLELAMQAQTIGDGTPATSNLW
jgi:hypothetical protein